MGTLNNQPIIPLILCVFTIYIYIPFQGLQRGGVQIKPVEVGPRHVDLAPDDARGRRGRFLLPGLPRCN